MAKKNEYGRWRIVASLDEGGQAHVFLAEDTTMEFPGQYVLKRLKNSARLDRFEREVGVTAGLRHPNILSVVDSDVYAPQPYYVAEFCEGGSLADVGAERFKGNISPTLEIIQRAASKRSVSLDAPIVATWKNSM